MERTPGKYLEFSKPEEYIKHLKSHNITKTGCKLNIVLSDSDESKVETYIVLTSDIEQSYIAVCGILVDRRYDTRKEKKQTKLDEATFDKIKEFLLEEGVEPLPETWKYEAPKYLK